MRMQLSEKGREKLAYLVDLDAPIEDLEFWPDDFTGAIIMTVEDAKILNRLIGRINDDSCLTNTEKVSWMTLKMNIEQAEGK